MKSQVNEWNIVMQMGCKVLEVLYKSRSEFNPFSLIFLLFCCCSLMYFMYFFLFLFSKTITKSLSWSKTFIFLTFKSLHASCLGASSFHFPLVIQLKKEYPEDPCYCPAIYSLIRWQETSIYIYKTMDWYQIPWGSQYSYWLTWNIVFNRQRFSKNWELLFDMSCMGSFFQSLWSLEFLSLKRLDGILFQFLATKLESQLDCEGREAINFNLFGVKFPSSSHDDDPSILPSS